MWIYRLASNVDEPRSNVYSCEKSQSVHTTMWRTLAPAMMVPALDATTPAPAQCRSHQKAETNGSCRRQQLAAGQG